MSTVLLCIDDRPEALQVRRESLEAYGYDVRTATNEDAALALLENPGAVAVLLEYKYEGIDAEALAYHVKQRFPSLPVILLSAYCDMPERILWLVDEVVMRSDSIGRLIEVVARATHVVPRPAAESGSSSQQRKAS